MARAATWVLLLLGLAAVQRPLSGGDDATPLAPAPLLNKLEVVAKDLAAKGRDGELHVLLDVLGKLGQEPAAIGKLREACDRNLAKVKVPAAGNALAQSAKTLHGVAGELVKLLPSFAIERRGALAEQILRLDDGQPVAHKILSHVEENGVWMTDEWQRCLLRRGEIQAALLESRKLPIELETDPIDFKPLKGVDPAPAFSVKYGSVEIISTAPVGKIERMLRSALRAAALSEFLRGRALKIPAWLSTQGGQRGRDVVLTSTGKYQLALQAAVAANAIPPEQAEKARDWSGIEDGRGFHWTLSVSEVGGYAQTLQWLSWRWLESGLQPCLQAGHVNWLCLACFGVSMPGVVWEPAKDDIQGVRTSARPRNTPEELAAKDLADAGISGARRWLLFKAMHGEDPAWSESFVDEVGKLSGLDLLKATFVVEYFQELSTFDPILRKTSKFGSDKQSRADVMAAAFPEGLAWFEQRFDEWLLPHGAALVQQLELGSGADKPNKEEEALLVALDRIRQSTWDENVFAKYEPVGLDRELSRSCAKHVAYLELNPKQLEAWPDAHEEYPDQEGFSTEGCSAGMSSVIAPGVATPEAALDAWMGTFYHRLPLLDPGLKRVGWSLAHDVAVLDVASLVDGNVREGFVLWPPLDGVNLPTRFNAELPNPVPGADQSDWGYPITVQTYHKNVELKLRLFLGTQPEGAEIPCHFSSPAAPTNLDLAPKGAFCLIPKAHLAARTKYTVLAEVGDGTKFQWTFTTGS